MTLDSGLVAALDELATATTLLVASDFDGVIAPIVSDPASVRARAESLEALEALSELSNTQVALVSGRSLEFLDSIDGKPARAWLAGSHGAELSHLPTAELDPQQRHLLELVTRDLCALAASTDGATVEEKAGSVAFHYRNVDPALVASLRATVLDGPGALHGVETKFGKMVIELAVFTADKGHAITAFRQATDADRVLYLGDDITDEDAFAVLGPDDLGVKVGEGETAATQRVADPEAVTLVLETLLRARRANQH